MADKVVLDKTTNIIIEKKYTEVSVFLKTWWSIMDASLQTDILTWPIITYTIQYLTYGISIFSNIKSVIMIIIYSMSKIAAQMRKGT